MASPAPSAAGDWQARPGPPVAPNEEFGVSVKPVGLKVHYSFGHEAHLARYNGAMNLQTISLDDCTTIGVVDLGVCLQLVTTGSPELASATSDYIIYSYDYSEPDAPLVGNGLLSRYKDQHAPTPQVTGRVTRNPLAFMSGGAVEILEVRLKLNPVVRPRGGGSIDLRGMEPAALMPSDDTDFDERSEFTPFSMAMMGRTPGRSVSRGQSPSMASVHSFASSVVSSANPSSFGPGFHPLQQSQTLNSSPSSSRPSTAMPVGTTTATCNQPTPIPVPEATDAMIIPPPSPPPSSTSSKRRSKAATSRPRGRPPKRNLPDGGTSGYEDGTDVENVPKPSRSRKRAKTAQAAKPPNPFAKNPESLRVAASTSGSLRNMRPLAASHPGGGPLVDGGNSERVPRAPSPFPQVTGRPPPKARAPSKLGVLPPEVSTPLAQVSALLAEVSTAPSVDFSAAPSTGPSTGPFTGPSTAPSMAPMQPPCSPSTCGATLAAPPPDIAHTSFINNHNNNNPLGNVPNLGPPTPADIRSSPPLLARRATMMHTSPPPSSPALSLSQVMRQDTVDGPRHSAFMSGGEMEADLPPNISCLRETAVPPPPQPQPPPPMLQVQEVRDKTSVPVQVFQIQGNNPEDFVHVRSYNSLQPSLPPLKGIGPPPTKWRNPPFHAARSTPPPALPGQSGQPGGPGTQQPPLPVVNQAAQVGFPPEHVGAHHSLYRPQPVGIAPTPPPTDAVLEHSFGPRAVDQDNNNNKNNKNNKNNSKNNNNNNNVMASLPAVAPLSAPPTSPVQTRPQPWTPHPRMDFAEMPELSPPSPIQDPQAPQVEVPLPTSQGPLQSQVPLPPLPPLVPPETRRQTTMQPPISRPGSAASLPPPVIPSIETEPQPQHVRSLSQPQPSQALPPPIQLPLPTISPLGSEEHDQNAPEAAPPKRARPNKNQIKKLSIKNKLEQAILLGEMPSYCSNCGAIQTPTWRKIWTRDYIGAPPFCEYSEKAGRITAIDILHRDEQNNPTSYRVIKKNLAADENKSEWTETFLCNPCGIWLSKCKSHRPSHMWDKDQKRLTQERRKWGTGPAPRATKPRAKGKKAQAQAGAPDACPSTGSALSSFEHTSPPPHGGDLPPSEADSSYQSSRRASTARRSSLTPLPPSQLTRGHSMCSNAGTVDSPIAIDDGEPTGAPVGGIAVTITRPKDEPQAPTTPAAAAAPAEHAPGELELDLEHAMTVAEIEAELRVGADDVDSLFRSPTMPRPSTPTCNTLDQDHHRPITRSISRTLRSDPDLEQLAALLQTPTKPSRTTPRTPRFRTSMLIEDELLTPTRRRSPRLNPHHPHHAFDSSPVPFGVHGLINSARSTRSTRSFSAALAAKRGVAADDRENMDPCSLPSAGLDLDFTSMLEGYTNEQFLQALGDADGLDGGGGGGGVDLSTAEFSNLFGGAGAEDGFDPAAAWEDWCVQGGGGVGQQQQQEGAPEGEAQDAEGVS